MVNYKIVKENDGEGLFALCDKRLREKGLNNQDQIFLSILAKYVDEANTPVFIHSNVFKFYGFSNYLVNKHKKKLEDLGLLTVSLKKNSEGIPMRLFNFNKTLEEFVQD